MTSTSIYTPITPTYLYIKQHSITKIKYFGKTTRNPIKYLGSGKYWKNHINKHGKEFVETIWLSEPYTNKDLLSEFALFFSEEYDIVNSSEEYDIVNSKEWANLNPENGLDGGVPGRTQSAEHIAKRAASRTGGKRSAESKAKMSAAKKDKPLSAETKAKMSASKTGRTHSAETKAKISASKTGRTHSAETKAKISASHLGNIKPKVKCPPL